jgi:hypothetical protein
VAVATRLIDLTKPSPVETASNNQLRKPTGNAAARVATSLLLPRSPHRHLEYARPRASRSQTAMVALTMPAPSSTPSAVPAASTANES